MSAPNGDATLYALAAMRSGLPSYTLDTSFQDTLFGDPNHVWTPQALVDVVKGREPMFAPGAKTVYSNTNLVLLGMAAVVVMACALSDAGGLSHGCCMKKAAPTVSASQSGFEMG